MAIQGNPSCSKERIAMMKAEFIPKIEKKREEIILKINLYHSALLFL